MHDPGRCSRREDFWSDAEYAIKADMQEGSKFWPEQVQVSTWKDGKIVARKYYDNPNFQDVQLVIIISAMSKDRVIGIGDGMPWDVPAEYEQYLRFVSGNTVILGRKSYEIFGPDLPVGTTPIVISRGAVLDGVMVASSLEQALAHAETLGKTVFIAGGGSVYERALPLADAMYLSTIKGEFEGDAFFPTFDPADWEVVEEREEPDFVFQKYRRR